MAVIVEGIENIQAYKAFMNLFPQDFGPVDIERMAEKAETMLEKENAEQEKESDINKIMSVVTDENPDPEKVDEAYNVLLNSKNLISEEDIEKLAKEAENSKEVQEMKEISEKVESGKLSSEGEIVTAAVSVNPITGERQVVDTNVEFEPDNTTFDELVENSDTDNIKIELSNEILEKSINDQFKDMIDEKELIDFVDLIREYKDGKVSAGEAFNRLPQSIKDHFNTQAAKAGIPVNNINSYRRAFIKETFGEFIASAELEQASVDFDKQIANIYKEYGNDVVLLYESGIFEKIKTVSEKLNDLEAENENGVNDSKIENIKGIIDSLYESIYLNKFASYAINAKIKPFEKEKPEKLFRDFIGKYHDSKFTINDVKNIIPILTKYCGFTEDEATEFAILFCKFVKPMRPSVLADHTFMYYFITNIIFINNLGAVDEEDEEQDRFTYIMKYNIKRIWELRQQRLNEQEVEAYEPLTISQEYMDAIMIRAEEKAKELEEESKKFDEELGDENDSENIEENAEEYNETADDSKGMGVSGTEGILGNE